MPGSICGFIFRFLESALAALVISCMVALDCFHVFFYVSYTALGWHGMWSLSAAIVDAAVLVVPPTFVAKLQSFPHISYWRFGGIHTCICV